MLEFTRIRKNLKKDFSAFKKVKVAILSDSASQHLAQALKGYGYDRQLNYEIYEADYDLIDQEILNPSSQLYAFAPEFIVISKNVYKLLSRFYDLGLEERNGFAENTAATIDGYLAAIQQQLQTQVMLLNIQEVDDRVFGNFANKLSHSFLYQVRKLNMLFMERAQQHRNLQICDVQQLTMEFGLARAIDQKNRIGADLIWSLDFLPLLAKNISVMIEAAKGSFKKCLVLDLDNTIWGGIIGDDGLEGIQMGNYGIGKAFTQLQKWAKELKKRGVILCVCSKNTEAIAREVFEKHPDMTLRTEDIAVFAVNWNNKVDNIHYIKNTLNIGFDSMVFLDDNPFERGMVKEAVPDMEVPELPEDPIDYLPYLQSLNLFETVSFTEEDQQRTALYKAEAERTAIQQVYQDEKEFLKSLQMVGEILPLDRFTIPRAAQLSQRSNQFNLRTIRYTEQDLERIALSPEYLSFVVKLADRFGDNGIISLVVAKKESQNLFIETWLMSCRVLKRGVEEFVLNHLLLLAKEHHCAAIVGEYIPTAKNGLVKDHYQKLGFTAKEQQWQLAVSPQQERTVFIQRVQRLKETVQ